MRFIKYHGLGNDFILLRGGMAGLPSPSGEEVVALCDRRRGIGADGVMLARPSERAALGMELINSDGTVPEMCGNGLRCLVKYAVEELGLADNPLTVETLAGVLRCDHAGAEGGIVESVRVAMGRPGFERPEVPMTGGGSSVGVEVPLGAERFRATGVNIGNPHMVIFDRGGREAAETWGPQLTSHPMWPEGTNVEFAQVRTPRDIDVTVWERGCGLTEACGTGATATAAAAVQQGLCPPEVPIAVNLPGGTLLITVAADLSQAWMEGPAVEVYRGAVGVS